MFDLSGRCAVVVGGTAGTGKAIALALACSGADVLASSRLAAVLHLGTALHNFGIQEHMPHTALTDEVFPHQYRFVDGYMHPGDAAGLGVDIDEAMAAVYPYQRAYLPIARKLDGTLTDW